MYISASSISLSSEAGKSGFFGGRVGIPGTYHKYISQQYNRVHKYIKNTSTGSLHITVS